MTIPRGIRRTARVSLYLLLGALVGLFAMMVLVPRLMGWVPLTIMSGSMEPTLPVGSQVVVERIDGAADVDKVGVGDVITFLPQPDDDTLVTHRIVGQSIRTDGTKTVTTRGDANGADDPDPVGAQQIRGKMRYHIPFAGYLASTLNTEQKGIGTFVVAALLFGYAGWQLLISLRQRRRRREVTHGEPEGDGLQATLSDSEADSRVDAT